MTDLSQIAAVAEGISLLVLLIYVWQSERRERLDLQSRILKDCEDPPAAAQPLTLVAGQQPPAAAQPPRSQQPPAA